jgi:hypothetical protein
LQNWIAEYKSSQQNHSSSSRPVIIHHPQVLSTPAVISGMTDTTRNNVGNGNGNGPNLSAANKEVKFFVGGLNTYYTTERSLLKYFSQFGQLSDIILKTDIYGVSRGFGFITFSNSRDLPPEFCTMRHSIDSRKVDLRPFSEYSKYSASTFKNSKPSFALSSSPLTADAVPAMRHTTSNHFFSTHTNHYCELSNDANFRSNEQQQQHNMDYGTTTVHTISVPPSVVPTHGIQLSQSNDNSSQHSPPPSSIHSAPMQSCSMAVTFRNPQCIQPPVITPSHINSACCEAAHEPVVSSNDNDECKDPDSHHQAIYNSSADFEVIQNDDFEW